MEHSAIPFNQLHTTGNELACIQDAISQGNLAGDGAYSKRCERFFEERFGFFKCLMTGSCTDALELAAIVLDLKPGDEVIMPAYTFVSTANAFVLRGAKPVFCDSREDHPNMDESLVEGLITERTKAIVVVHYAGMACKMDVIMDIASRHGLKVVEDAAQAVGAHFIDDQGVEHPLGGIGHLGTFSFDGQKNINCGEGGMLVVNSKELVARAEIAWQKGTNRAAFFRGEVDKYGWVDVGSNFTMSELNAAFLFAQLQELDAINAERRSLWEAYWNLFKESGESVALPHVPQWATNNGHIFYLVCETLERRTHLLERFKAMNIGAAFHYQSLSRSQVVDADSNSTPQSNRYSDCLIRLPMYVGFDFHDLRRRIESLHKAASF